LPSHGEGGTNVKRAWLLIKASPGAARDLVEPIASVEGVLLIDLLEGEFDLSVAIELPDEESLTRAVDTIRELKGVEQVLVQQVIATYQIVAKGPDRGWP